MTKTYCFDIDGTICSQVRGDYNKAQPFVERIEHINDLYADGHVIKLFTARGATSGIDWENDTKSQLASWGLKYHELILGKPHADVFVDDKSVHPDSYFRSRIQ
jgi:hypothetical protein